MGSSFTLQEAVSAYEAGGWKIASRRSGGGLNGKCPCCGGEDRFWIGLGDTAVTVRCNQGCGFKDLVTKLGLDYKRAPRPDPDAVYSYRNSSGDLVLNVYRYGPGTYFPPTRKHPDGETTSEKTFRQRAASGEWKRPKAAASLIYRLPEVLAAVASGDRIVVVEGEKDAERLAALGICATCNLGGAASAKAQRAKWQASHAQHLKGAKAVCVIPDADEPGLAHAQAVAATLKGMVERVTVVDPLAQFGFEITKEHGRDVSDWLDDGQRDADALNNVLDEVRPIESQSSTPDQPPTEHLRNPTPHGVAVQLIERHAESLLLVRRGDGDRDSVRVLDDPSGVWLEDKNALTHWLSALCEERWDRAHEAIKKEGNFRQYWQSIRDYRGALGRGIDMVLRDFGGAYLSQQQRGGMENVARVKRLMRVCDEDALDRNGRYLGARNGIIDLHTGELLEPSVGRDMLVTRAVRVEYRRWEEQDSEAKADVERLFEFLDPEAAAFWWQALAFALLGTIGKRFYIATGSNDGGKSALLNALQAALGDYAPKAPRDALDAARRSGSAGLSPELSFFRAPSRMVLFDEVEGLRMNDGLIRDITGGSGVQSRDLHEKFKSARVMATIIIFCNRVPRMRLHLPAMRTRYVEIPYPVIPEERRIEGYRERMMERGGAVLARLVRECSQLESKVKPPELPAVVSAATTARAQADAGAIGEFVTRLVPEGFQRLPVSDVWAAWCGEQGLAKDSTEAGGIKRMSFTSLLEEFVTALPRATKMRVNGRVVKAWLGWKLLDEPPKTVEEPSTSVELSKTTEDVLGALDHVMGEEFWRVWGTLSDDPNFPKVTPKSIMFHYGAADVPPHPPLDPQPDPPPKPAVIKLKELSDEMIRRIQENVWKALREVEEQYAPRAARVIDAATSPNALVALYRAMQDAPELRNTHAFARALRRSRIHHQANSGEQGCREPRPSLDAAVRGRSLLLQFYVALRAPVSKGGLSAIAIARSANENPPPVIEAEPGMTPCLECRTPVSDSADDCPVCGWEPASE